MYCPQCGNANEDSASFLRELRLQTSEVATKSSGPSRQGAATTQQPTPRRPPGTGACRPHQPSIAAPQPLPPYQQPRYQQPPYQHARRLPASGAIRPPGTSRAMARRDHPEHPQLHGLGHRHPILRFWPTGIVAIVYATKVGNLLPLGDVPGAQEASRKAKMWSWITFGIGVAAVVIAMIIVHRRSRSVAANIDTHVLAER